MYTVLFWNVKKKKREFSECTAYISDCIDICFFC